MGQHCADVDDVVVAKKYILRNTNCWFWNVLSILMMNNEKKHIYGIEFYRWVLMVNLRHYPGIGCGPGTNNKK